MVRVGAPGVGSPPHAADTAAAVVGEDSGSPIAYNKTSLPPLPSRSRSGQDAGSHEAERPMHTSPVSGLGTVYLAQT